MNTSIRCKYCGARLVRDDIGMRCPTHNCDWQHGFDEPVSMCRCWGALWRERDSQGRVAEYLLRENTLPVLFRTRREAREWIDTHYGYITRRPDLRAEPFRWRMPCPVRVTVNIAPT